MVFSDNMGLDDNMSAEELARFDEWVLQEQKKCNRERFEKQRNIQRDKRGRLNKGALLAQKESCDKDKIWLMKMSGMTVQEIVDCMGCSKSTVYDVIKQRKEGR